MQLYTKTTEIDLFLKQAEKHNKQYFHSTRNLSTTFQTVSRKQSVSWNHCGICYIFIMKWRLSQGSTLGYFTQISLHKEQKHLLFFSVSLKSLLPSFCKSIPILLWRTSTNSTCILLLFQLLNSCSCQLHSIMDGNNKFGAKSSRLDD